jgi:hypothetical protein
VTGRRVIVGIDAGSPLDRAALETAAGIAGRIEGELAGLFVENVDLLHLAALPFTREVGFTSIASRELDVARMERSLKAAAGEAHRMLEAAAARARIRWSFDVTRDGLVEALASAVTRADLVLVPGRPARPRAGLPRIRVIRARDRGALRAALNERSDAMLALTGGAEDAVERVIQGLLETQR